MASQHLFLARTTNGSSASRQITTPVTLYISGVFGGCSVAVELSSDDVTFIPVKTVTAAEVVQIYISSPSYLRITISGATGTTSITVAIG